MFKKIRAAFLAVKNYVDGDFAYDEYLAHHKKHHAESATLDKKQFLKNRQKEKFEKINRCC